MTRSIQFGSWQAVRLAQCLEFLASCPAAAVRRFVIWGALGFSQPPSSFTATVLACGRWPQDLHAIMLSVSATADLMDPAAWSATPALRFDQEWAAAAAPPLPLAGFLEGALKLQRSHM